MIFLDRIFSEEFLTDDEIRRFLNYILCDFLLSNNSY